MSKLDLKNWNHEGYAWISGTHGNQLRYNSEENKTEWLIPIAAYKVGNNSIKFGQPVSIGLKEQLSDDSYEDDESAIVVTNPSVNDCAIGLALQPGADNDDHLIHVQQYGQIEYDLSKQGNNYYCPPNEKGHFKWFYSDIGKTVYVSNRSKGELTLDVEDAAFDGGTIISVGHLADAPRNERDLNQKIVIDVQLGGDTRGNVDATQISVQMCRFDGNLDNYNNDVTATYDSDKVVFVRLINNIGYPVLSDTSLLDNISCSPVGAFILKKGECIKDYAGKQILLTRLGILRGGFDYDAADIGKTGYLNQGELSFVSSSKAVEYKVGICMAENQFLVDCRFPKELQKAEMVGAIKPVFGDSLYDPGFALVDNKVHVVIYNEDDPANDKGYDWEELITQCYSKDIFEFSQDPDGPFTRYAEGGWSTIGNKKADKNILSKTHPVYFKFRDLYYTVDGKTCACQIKYTVEGSPEQQAYIWPEQMYKLELIAKSDADVYVLGGAAGTSTVKINITSLVGLGAYMDNNSQNIEAYDIIVRDTATGRLISPGFWQNTEGKWCGYEWQVQTAGDNTYLAMVTIPEGKTASECYGFTYPIGEKMVQDQKVILDVIVRRRPVQYNVFFLNQLPTASPWLPNKSASGNLITNTAIHFGSIVIANDSYDSNGVSGVSEVGGYASIDVTDTDVEGKARCTTYINSADAKKFYDVVSFPNTSYSNIAWIYDLENNVVSLSAEFAPNLIAPSNKVSKYIEDADTDALATLHQIDVSKFDYDEAASPWYKYGILNEALTKYSKVGYNDSTHINDPYYNIKFMSLFDKDITFKADTVTKFYKNLTDDIEAIWKNKEYMSYVSIISLLTKAAAETEDRLLHLERAAFGSNLVTDPTNNSDDKHQSTAEYDIEGLFGRGSLYANSVAKKFGFITDLTRLYEETYYNENYLSNRGTSNYAKFDNDHSSVFLNFLIDNYSDYYTTDDLKDLRNEWLDGISNADDKGFYIYKRIADFVNSHIDTSTLTGLGFNNFERNTMFVNALQYVNFIPSHNDIFEGYYEDYTSTNFDSDTLSYVPLFNNKYSLIAKNITFSKIKNGYLFEFEEKDGEKTRIDDSYGKDVLYKYTQKDLNGVPFKWPIQADKSFEKYFDPNKNNSLEKIFFENTVFGLSDKIFDLKVDNETNNYSYKIKDQSITSQSLEGYMFDIIAKLSFLRKEHTDETVFKGVNTFIDPYIYLPLRFGVTPLVNDIAYFNNEDSEYPVYSAFTFKNNKIFKGYSLEFKGDISKTVYFSSELARSKAGYSGAYFSWEKNGVPYKFTSKRNNKLIDYGITEPFEDIFNFWNVAFNNSTSIGALKSLGISAENFDIEADYWTDFFDQYRDNSKEKVTIPDLLVAFRPTKADYEFRGKSIQRSLIDPINNFNDHFNNSLTEEVIDTILPQGQDSDNEKYDSVSVTRVIGTRRDIIDDRSPLVKLKRDGDTRRRDFNSYVNNQSRSQNYKASGLDLHDSGNEKYLYVYCPSYEDEAYFYNDEFSKKNFKNISKVDISKVYSDANPESYHDGYIEYTYQPVSAIANNVKFNKKWIYKRLYFCDMSKEDIIIKCERKRDKDNDEFYVYWYDDLPIYIQGTIKLSNAVQAIFKADNYTSVSSKSSSDYISAYESEQIYLDDEKEDTNVPSNDPSGKINANDKPSPIDLYYLCKFKEYCESGVNQVDFSSLIGDISSYFVNDGIGNYYLMPPANDTHYNKIRELCTDIETSQITFAGSYSDLNVLLNNKIFYLSPYTKSGQKDFYITEGHYVSGSIYFEYIDGQEDNSINIDVTNQIDKYVDASIANSKVNEKNVHDFYNDNISNYTENLDELINKVINTQVKEWINSGIKDSNNVISEISNIASANLTSKLQSLIGKLNEINAKNDAFALDATTLVTENVNTALSSIQDNVKSNLKTLITISDNGLISNINNALVNVNIELTAKTAELNAVIDKANGVFKNDLEAVNAEATVNIKDITSDIVASVNTCISSVVESFTAALTKLAQDTEERFQSLAEKLKIAELNSRVDALIAETGIDNEGQPFEPLLIGNSEPLTPPKLEEVEEIEVEKIQDFNLFEAPAQNLIDNITEPSQFPSESAQTYDDGIFDLHEDVRVEDPSMAINTEYVTADECVVEGLFGETSTETYEEDGVEYERKIIDIPEIKDFEEISLEKMWIPELVGFDMYKSLIFEADEAWSIEEDGEIFNIDKMTALITLGNTPGNNALSYTEVYPERHAEGWFEIQNNYNESEQKIQLEIETSKTKTALALYGLNADEKLPSLKRILRPGDEKKIINTFEFDDDTYIYGAQLPQIDSFFKLRSAHINDIFSLSQSEKPAKKNIIEDIRKPDIEPEVIEQDGTKYNNIIVTSYPNKFKIKDEGDNENIIDGVDLVRVITNKPLDTTMHYVFFKSTKRNYLYEEEQSGLATRIEPDLDLRNISCWKFNNLEHTGLSSREAVNDLKSSYMAEYGSDGPAMWDKWCRKHGWYPWPDGTDKNYFGGCDIFKYSIDGGTEKFDYMYDDNTKLRDCTDDQIRAFLATRSTVITQPIIVVRDGVQVEETEEVQITNDFLDSALGAGHEDNKGNFIYYQYYILKSTKRNYFFAPLKIEANNQNSKRYLSYNKIGAKSFVVFSDTKSFIEDEYDVHGCKVQKLNRDKISGDSLIELIADSSKISYASGSKIDDNDDFVTVINSLNDIYNKNLITSTKLENKEDFINSNLLMPELNTKSSTYKADEKVFELNINNNKFLDDDAFIQSNVKLEGID